MTCWAFRESSFLPSRAGRKGWCRCLGSCSQMSSPANLLQVLLTGFCVCSPANGHAALPSVTEPGMPSLPVFANWCFCPGAAETRTSPGERSVTSARLPNQKGFFHPLSPLQVCAWKSSRQGWSPLGFQQAAPSPFWGSSGGGSFQP